MSITMKVVKEVAGKKYWEIQNCPDGVYSELDQLGLIPQMGIVSRPRNVAIAPGREDEVVRFLEKRGLEFEKIGN